MAPNDEAIAKALLGIDRLATQEGFMSGWHGHDDRQIREFIERHPR